MFGEDSQEDEGRESDGGAKPPLAGRERFVPPAGLVERVRAAMGFAPRHGEEEEEEAQEEEVPGFRREDLTVDAEMFDVCPSVELLIDLCHAVEADVIKWADLVLSEGLSAGWAEEVEPLAARLAQIEPTSRHRFLWAAALLEAGRRDEAYAAMAAYRPADRPEAVRHRIRTAALWGTAGDHEAAERELRAVLALRWLSNEARREAVEALAPILARTGRSGEATRMLNDLDAQRWARLMGRPAPVRRESPKVGRNDPCPCGSGKKFKKCCGAGGG